MDYTKTAHDVADAITDSILGQVARDQGLRLRDLRELNPVLCATAQTAGRLTAERKLKRLLEPQTGDRDTPFVPDAEYDDRLERTQPGYRLPRGVRSSEPHD